MKTQSTKRVDDFDRRLWEGAERTADAIVERFLRGEPIDLTLADMIALECDFSRGEPA